MLPIQQYETPYSRFTSCLLLIQQYESVCAEVLTESTFSSERFSIIVYLSVEWATLFSGPAAACCIHSASRQSRAHNHLRLSALLNGPIDQAGPRLISVLRDQNYLAVSPAEQTVALAAFRLPPDTDDVQIGALRNGTRRNCHG